MEMMNTQINLFTGEQLRDAGIKRAIDNANEKTEKWAYMAYTFLTVYVRSNGEFMTEDVRLASSEIVPQPPSNRAWGGVIVRAVKSGLIIRKGFRNVKNNKAHCTPASVWVKA
jgi:hypothetical protein